MLMSDIWFQRLRPHVGLQGAAVGLAVAVEVSQQQVLVGGTAARSAQQAGGEVGVVHLIGEARGDLVDDPAERTVSVVVVHGAVAAGLQLLHLASAVRPKRKMFSSPAAGASPRWRRPGCRWSGAPFIINFMLPVPLASLPAVEICSLELAGGHEALSQRDPVVLQKTTWSLSLQIGSAAIWAARELMSWMIF